MVLPLSHPLDEGTSISYTEIILKYIVFLKVMFKSSISQGGIYALYCRGSRENS